MFSCVLVCSRVLVAVWRLQVLEVEGDCDLIKPDIASTDRTDHRQSIIDTQSILLGSCGVDN